MRTQVGIVGAGPAGLTLAQLLARDGIEATVLESRSREYVEHRIRAGVLEEGSAHLLREAGVGERLDREGIVHTGIYLQFEGERHHLSFAELAGAGILVYGQTEVVKDLIAARLAAGLPLQFEAEAVAVHDIASERPRIEYVQHGERRELACDVVVGCDGFHGVCRDAMPRGTLRTYERDYPFGWLGILADVAPSTDELVYTHSDRGFALLSHRSPTLSRYYLQVAHDEDVEAWPDERIWEELQLRTGLKGWQLEEGPVLEKGLTGMRSFVCEPMQHGRLFLAGDAAHIVPPTGAKGLNLALRDAHVLADALVDWFGTADRSGLDAYSERCLSRVWRCEHFSWWMTTMLHLQPNGDEFDRKLQLAQLRHVTTSPAAGRMLAENYTGIVAV